MTALLEEQRQRIREAGKGFLERDAVLPLVHGCLRRIPLVAEALHSTTRCKTGARCAANAPPLGRAFRTCPSAPGGQIRRASLRLVRDENRRPRRVVRPPLPPRELRLLLGEERAGAFAEVFAAAGVHHGFGLQVEHVAQVESR